MDDKAKEPYNKMAVVDKERYLKEKKAHEDKKKGEIKEEKPKEADKKDEGKVSAKKSAEKKA